MATLLVGAVSAEVAAKFVDDLKDPYKVFTVTLIEESTTRGSFKVQAVKFCSKGGRNMETIHVVFSGSDWLFLKGAAVKVDDQVFEDTDPRPSRDVGKGYVLEQLHLFRNGEIFQALAGASAIRVQINSRIFSVSPESTPGIVADIGILHRATFEGTGL